MKTTVYLIRHAAYESPDHILPFRLPGFHVSDAGKLAAKKLAEYFSTKTIDAVYSSPLERTMETATIIAGKQNVIRDDRLLEVRSPAQGKPEGFPESMGGWKMYETDWYTHQHGETPEEVRERMKDFMEEKVAAHNGKEIIVVSHGDPIMFYYAQYVGKLFTDIPYVQMGTVLTLVY